MVNTAERPPRLLYVGDIIPRSGGGGEIVVQRHLARLADEGWAVTAVMPYGNAGPERNPAIVYGRLPLRRWWWLPFRPAHRWLTNLRMSQLRGELARQHIDRANADVIVTVCWGATSLMAASLAKARRRPLVAIVHDWWGESGSADNARLMAQVCQSAHVILVVSEEMKSALAEFGANKLAVLYPVPEERFLPFVEWREEFAQAPVVTHVGALHSYHVDYLCALAACLASVGGKLSLICPAGNPVLAELRARIANFEHHDFFPTNIAAIRHVAAQSAALTVMYPLGTTPRGLPPTGFPSRFVEFAQLGLPVLLAAPAGNPIRTWAGRNGWTAQLDPSDREAMTRLVHELVQRAGWERLAAETRAAAEGEFNPSRLHRQFSTTLREVIGAVLQPS